MALVTTAMTGPLMNLVAGRVVEPARAPEPSRP